MIYNSYKYNRQSLQMADIEVYVKKPSDLMEFVNNVQLDYKQPTLGFIHKIIQVWPVHWILPIRTLCLRYINQLKIINSLHHKFLKQAVDKYFLTQALPIVQSIAVPFKIQYADQCQYQYLCFQIYFKLGMYEKAWKKIEKLIVKLKPNQLVRKIPKYTKVFLLMARLNKNAVIDKQILTVYLNGINAKQPNQQQFIHQNLINYAQNKPYNFSPQLQIILKQDKLFQQIYELGKESHLQLRQYVLDLKQDRLQRVRLSQIKDKPLNDPFYMQLINKYGNICRYDCKERILYINHEKATNDQINQLISKCFNLHVAIQDMPKIRDQVRDKLLSGFGGIGFQGFSRLNRMMM